MPVVCQAVDKNTLQTTLKNGFSFSGRALHSGKSVDIRCIPSCPDTGIVFKRTDLINTPVIPACPANIVSTLRSTRIGTDNGKVSVNAVEHILAAFAITGLDNVLVEIDGDELPAADGSALPFAGLVIKSGIRQLDRPAGAKKIKAPMFAREKDAILAVIPFDGLRFSYTLSYEHPHVGTQYGDYIFDNELFMKEIAPARTFGFATEVERLHSMGLALGGAPDNAVLFAADGPLDRLRFRDEPLRHKILDITGDLFMAGRLQGHFIGIKSGHSLNASLSRMIFSQYGSDYKAGNRGCI